ncbi:MAG: carboxypeptidase M32 [Litorimonas sp.]
MTYELFERRFAAINDLLNIANQLTWDFRTMMPTGGAAMRGIQMSTLMGMAHELMMSAETRKLVDAAETEVIHLSEDSIERRCVTSARDAHDYHQRIPRDLHQRRAELNLTGQGVWERARAQNDFELLRPVYEEHVEIARRLADCIGYDEHPHDAMISIYEPGMTTAMLADLFTDLRDGLKPLVAAIAEVEQPRTDFLFGDYPIKNQKIFTRGIAEAFGYDFERGRIDIAPHPFEISQTREDVRITTRYNRNSIVSALQSTMHEVGHGIYEQQIDPALTRSVLTTDLFGLYGVGGISFGVHESQSRLWENQIGRSRGFWERHFGDLRDLFSDTLRDVDAEGFYRAYSSVQPGRLRTEADELTYDLHIMLRVEIERRLMDRSLAVADIPRIWRELTQENLGIEVENDRDGVLQDMQWSAGQFGIFCGYTVGNIIAAQLQQTIIATEASTVRDLDDGKYASLRNWLGENLHKHGRRYSRDEILETITGRGVDAKPYLSYLTRKYRDIYNLPISP